MVTAGSEQVAPEDAAEALAASHDDQPEWLDRFSWALDRRRQARQVRRFLDIWGLSSAEAARVLGLSRQALAKWSTEGIPAGRRAAVADLVAATELLVHYLQRDRIPAVVRRPIADAGGRSLLKIASEDPAEALAAARAMFDFALIQQ